MKRKVVDTECFPNYFLALFKNIDTGEFKKIELFNNEGNLPELVDTVSNSYLISYNGLDYDDIMINFIIANINTITNEDIYNFSKYIIFSKHEDNYYDKIRPYKYSKLYKTIDLMRMLFSKKLRVSLKSLQIMLKWHNVLECELSFDEPVSEYDIESVIYYCSNDVSSTEYLAEFCKKDIQLRFKIQDKYNIDVLSMDGVNIGATLLFDSIAKKTNSSLRKVKKIRGESKPFYLSEIINEIIYFKDPILNELLDDIKAFKYTHRINYFEKVFNFRGTRYSVGSGGIHSVTKSKIFEPAENELYWQIDAGSYYPCQRNYLNYKHETLGDLFCEADNENLEQRFIAKAAGDKVEDVTRKLSLNGSFGLMGQEHSPLFSPRMLMQTTINGQLLMLMITEWMEDIGVNVVAANTDSIDIIFKKDKEVQVRELMSKWTKLTNGISMGEDNIAKAVYSDINAYFWKFTDGSIKEKGRWTTHYNKDGVYAPKMLNKGFNHPIINIALREYFMNNIPVEDTIYNHSDILDFCMAKRANRDYTVYHGNGSTGLTKVQRVNRYYASTKGGYLYKEKNGKYNHMLKGQGVTILNLCEKKELKSYTDLDYRWYIKQCKKQIEDIMPSQLVLF